MVSNPTIELKMEEDKNSNTTGIRFCFTEHRSLIHMVKEECPGVADDLEDATNVQRG